MKTNRKLGLLFAALMLAPAAATHAAEYHFFTQATQKGCASIITESGQRECAAVQQAKNDACNVAIEADPDKQERLIAKYKEIKPRLDRGEVADADKDKLAQTVRTQKDELDRAKEAASKGISIAEKCVAARENVQKWFKETGIPLTERTRDDALRIRKDLLDKLADTQKKQADAKSKRDAQPRDSSAQSDFDRATDEMRNAEKALEQFNNKYGKDIENWASVLINQYKSEAESHEKPLAESRNRLEACKKVAGMSY
jgi:hypothetical protein